MSLTLALHVIGWYGPGPLFRLPLGHAAEHTEGEAAKLSDTVSGHVVEPQFPRL